MILLSASIKLGTLGLIILGVIIVLCFFFGRWLRKLTNQGEKEFKDGIDKSKNNYNDQN